MNSKCFSLFSILNRMVSIFLLSLPTLGICQSNLVLALDGQSGFVSVPSSAELQNPTAITLEAWIFPEPPLNGVHNLFLFKGHGGNAASGQTYQLDWVVAGGNTEIGVGAEFSFFLGTNTWAVLGAKLPETNWVHIAATFDSTTGLYVLFTNGVLAASTTNDVSGKVPLIGQGLRQTSLLLGIGGRDGQYGSLAKGYMDEIRIWNRSLSADEIASDYSCSMVGEPGLVAYWNFDDGTAKDLTGNGNNGTLVGGASIVPILGPDVIHAGCLATAPIITKEPQSQVLLVDEGTSLSVVAHGNGRLAFQWYVGVSGDKSNPVPGATNSVLAVSPLYVSVNFWVFVSDLFGTVNSATAVIRALPVSTPRLNIEMAAGLPFLSIEGLVGTAYRIQ